MAVDSELPDVKAPALLFLLERMAHIRSFCLTVRGHGSHLASARAILQEGNLVFLQCTLELGDLVRQTSIDYALRLEFGEAIAAAPGTVFTCQVSGGFVYLQVPLSPPSGVLDGKPLHCMLLDECQLPMPCLSLPDRRVRTLSAGVSDVSSSRWREEVGLYHRAASQRRRERAALSDARLYCRRCYDRAIVAHCAPPTTLFHVSDISLPDADVTELADAIQCCNEINFDWRCIFPTGDDHSVAERTLVEAELIRAPRAERDGDAPKCFLGAHSFHICAPPPPVHTVQCHEADAFREPPCYRHTTSSVGVGVWAPISCAHCKAILGALRLGEGDEHGPSASIPLPRPQPLWFDVAAPPELHCNLQLIKGALRAVPFVGATALDSALDGYSMAALVADRILRTAEEAETSPRCFALVASSSTVLAELVETTEPAAGVAALIWLLSPYTTLATNYCTSLGGGARSGGESGRSGAAASSAGFTDAVKVLYTSDSRLIAAQLTRNSLRSGGTVCIAHSVARLLLPDADARAEVVAVMHASTLMMPPAARDVGALRVGFLPVAATWD